MNLKAKLALSTLLMLAGLLVMVAGANVLESTAAVVAVGMVIVLGGLVLYLRWHRCPYCGMFLGREGIPRFCPNCGKPIDPDAKP